MTDAEKVAFLKALVGDVYADDMLTAYLTLAGQKILLRAYPFDRTQTLIPSEYETLQCEVAAYLLNRRGAEGQTGHSENGISRTYENADVPESLMAYITPRAGVFPA